MKKKVKQNVWEQADSSELKCPPTKACVKRSRLSLLLESTPLINVKQTNLQEIQNYEMCATDLDVDPLEWWKIHGSSFPKLQKLALNDVLQ